MEAVLYTILELIFIGFVIVGVASIYVPAAVILAGLIGVVLVEKASTDAKVREAKK